MSRLILASGSVYRRQMLERLGLKFEVDPADIDESPCPGEDGASLARRLSREKAETVAKRSPGAIVIGADQVAECNGRLLGKPGNAERAAEQLAWMSGRTVVYHSAMVFCQDERRDEVLVPTVLRMRRLTLERIERYLELDRPYDCAGAMRSESLGVTLVESISSDDPTALIGLPLIACVRLLEDFGVDCLSL